MADKKSNTDTSDSWNERANRSIFDFFGGDGAYDRTNEELNRRYNEWRTNGGGEGEGSETDGEGEGESDGGTGGGAAARWHNFTGEYAMDLAEKAASGDERAATALDRLAASMLADRQAPERRQSDDGDTPADEGSASDPGGEDKSWYDKYIGDPVAKYTTNPAEKVGEAVEDELGRLGQGGGELGSRAAAEQLAEAQKEVGKSGTAIEGILDAIGGTGNGNGEATPPGTDPAGDLPSPGDGPARDPTDINPTSQVNPRAWDMFDQRHGTAPSGGSGYTGGSGSANTGGSGSGTSGSAPSTIDAGWRTDPAPFPSGGGTSGSSGSSSGSSGGDSDPGSSGDDGDSGSGASGSSGDDSGAGGSTSNDASGSGGGESYDLDGDGKDDIVYDDEGNVVVDNWSSTDDDDTDSGGEEPGVSTSVDPTGDQQQPTAEDLERAKQWAQFRNRGGDNVDPQEGGYSEYRGDGSGEPRWGRPGVGQPAPFNDNSEPPGVPGAITPGGDQGGYTDPSPLDDSEPQADGPYQDDPFSDPTLGSGPLPNPAQSSSDDEPLAVAVEGELNYGDQGALPVGYQYEAFDPDSYHASDDSGSDGSFEAVVNRLASADDDGGRATFIAITAYTPDRSGDGDDDNPFD